jgi:hypothetical protein
MYLFWRQIAKIYTHRKKTLFGIHNYVHFIYPDKLEIKNNTESDISSSYLDILLNIHSNDRLTTALYDKRDDFNFAIVNFPFYVVIYHSYLFMVTVYIS